MKNESGFQAVICCREKMKKEWSLRPAEIKKLSQVKIEVAYSESNFPISLHLNKGG